MHLLELLSHRNVQKNLATHLANNNTIGGIVCCLLCFLAPVLKICKVTSINRIKLEALQLCSPKQHSMAICNGGVPLCTVVFPHTAVGSWILTRNLQGLHTVELKHCMDLNVLDTVCFPSCRIHSEVNSFMPLGGGTANLPWHFFFLSIHLHKLKWTHLCP